jgi:anti-sigma28 factor (negative regulator of flagellin synthesis)
MCEVVAMAKETWNSWTCSAEDDEMGCAMGGSSAKQEGARKVWRRRARRSWLERAFQASLENALECSIPLEAKSEIRMDLVERVRLEIVKGTYRIAAEDLAAKLIQTMRGAGV